MGIVFSMVKPICNFSKIVILSMFRKEKRIMKNRSRIKSEVEVEKRCERNGGTKPSFCMRLLNACRTIAFPASVPRK